MPPPLPQLSCPVHGLLCAAPLQQLHLPRRALTRIPLSLFVLLQLSTFTVNYVGHPFNSSIRENRGMFNSVRVMAVFLFVIVFDFVPGGCAAETQLWCCMQQQLLTLLRMPAALVLHA